ncbi:MAG: redox-regulated ATPase YchF [Candidatus Levyibacteriota bacterium]
MSSSSLSVGIVGLPNVGKSTLFNALLKKQQALAANYPFATIEPNVGIVPVPDSRLTTLAEITKTEEKMTALPPIKPATVEFYDIAGLVKGASEGAGLGNKFLSHIREVSIICHVVRAFEDENIIKEGAVDPKSDYITINTELMLSDMQTLEKVRDNRKTEPLKIEAAKKLIAGINTGTPARNVSLSQEEQEAVKDLFLLSGKKGIVVLNVAETDYMPEKIETITNQFAALFGMNKDKFVVICAKIESDLSELTLDEQKQYLADLGLQESGLERLIQQAYHELGLISFLTCGEKEVRAWTIGKGFTAVLAAGEIHTDFMKKFIKAEVVSFDDFVQNSGWKGSREKGRARLEGKDYIMQDGDVVEFKIGS